ncbi:hypothetical protein ACIGQE_21405 [Streptomyces sp. NPDC053429]|uniref:hypothetical protein n=1 Tax=Streptomyces sp. NPDC053429 TaxID=3365702 RepID=UPI0037D66239
MSGTEDTIAPQSDAAPENERGAANEGENSAANEGDNGAANGKRLKAAAIVVAGLGFVIGGSLLAPDPQPSGWVAEPASTEPPLYAGPGPTGEQVTADMEAATATAGLGPAAPPRAFAVPGCLAAWESYETGSDAGLTALADGLTSHQWQLTARRKSTFGSSLSLTKGTWQLMVVHDKRPGAREHLRLLASNGTPTCEEAFRQAEAAGNQAV